MELPEFGAGARVECARIAGFAALRYFADGGAEHDDVLVDERNPVPADLDVDCAVFAETLRCLTGNGVD